METKNLEYICAKYGHDIQTELSESIQINKSNKSKIENVITKSLGVLEHDGVYALFLYLASKIDKSEFKIDEKKLAKRLFCVLLEMIYDMNNNEIINNNNCKDLVKVNYCKEEDDDNNKISERNRIIKKIFRALQEITKDRNTLYLIKTVFEKSLIYGRYHVKALEEKKQK